VLLIATHSLYVHRNNNALRTKPRRRSLDKIGIMNGGCIDTHFISAGIEQRPNITQGAYTAANSERNEDLSSNSLNSLYRGVSLLVTRSNIEKSYLIGTLLVVAPSNFNRVTSIPNAYEINTLNNPALINIEAGNNAAR
jgi:hypothetical protein